MFAKKKKKCFPIKSVTFQLFNKTVKAERIHAVLFPPPQPPIKYIN